MRSNGAVRPPGPCAVVEEENEMTGFRGRDRGLSIRIFEDRAFRRRESHPGPCRSAQGRQAFGKNVGTSEPTSRLIHDAHFCAHATYSMGSSIVDQMALARGIDGVEPFQRGAWSFFSGAGRFPVNKNQTARAV